MDKPVLSVSHLSARGFASCVHWEVSDGRIRSSSRPPACAGVYAFAQAGRVLYVGLASVNVASRLRFYQTPGPSQRTNVRINRQIAEATGDSIEIFVACPPDFEWNGLKVRGAEGLEAGLIASYALPWNQRGQVAAASTAPARPATASTSASTGTLAERVEQAIRQRPRLTEAEIARLIFGRGGYQQKVNPVCRKLLQLGTVRRIGGGGTGDPYVYVIR